MFDLLVKFGGRRFILTVCCSGISTVLVWFGKISGGEFVTVISLTAAAYIAGNGVQKYVEAKSNESIGQNTSQPD